MFTSLSIDLMNSRWFGDLRLSRRLGHIVTQLLLNFGHSLPQSMGNKHQTKAAYAFMSNTKVDVEGLYSSDAYRLTDKIRLFSGLTYLAISDTTTLNYTTNKSSGQLGYLDTIKQKGYQMQTLMLSDDKGCPEGLLRSGFYNRRAEDLHKSAKVNSSYVSKQPIEEKESYRWLEDLETLHTLFGTLTQHRFVHVMDREGDIFEVFSARRYDHIHVLCRLHHNRKLVDKDLRIKALVTQQDPIGELELTILDCRKKDANDPRAKRVKRKVVLEIRIAPVRVDVPHDLKVHQKSKGYTPLDLYVIHTREIPNPDTLSDEFEPLEWFLITSMPIQTAEQAIEAIQYYANRWRIEDFHLVLKEGAEVENFQYEDDHQLKNALTVYAIVAIQVLRLRCLDKTQPNESCEILGFQPKAYEIVADFLIQTKNVKIIKKTQPTVRDFVQLLMILGTGNPKATGVRALWKGLRDFYLIYQAFLLGINST
jgi:Transposase DNA-binding